MYIQKLTIENIRGLKHFEMTFPDNPAGWHVIIGDNGAGKSTLIRAISLGLIGPNEVRAAHPNFAEWLRKGEKKGSVALALLSDKRHDYATSLGKTGKLTAKVLLQSAHSLNGLRGGTPLVEAIADDNGKATPDKYLWSSSAKGWFSAGFGPFRRFTGGDTELDKVYLSSPRCGAHLSVFGEDVALTEVLNWLKEIDYQQLKAREKKIRQNANPLNLADDNNLPAGSETDVLSEVKQLWEMAARLRTSSLFTEAESLLRRALAITEKNIEPEHPDVATGLSNLAQLLKDTNRLAEAEPLMRRALAIGEASLGPEHPSVASRLSNLAMLLKDTNRLSEAEPLLRRALAIGEASFGPEHPDMAIQLSNLAQLLQDTNRLAEAEPLMRRALAIGEASLGTEHPDVAIRLNNLALLLQDTNQLAEAEPLLRRALAIGEASLGPEHPSVAIRLNNLAQLLQETNRLAEAEPLLRRALAIGEASLGPEHPKVATRLSNLALLLQETNRLAEAEPFLRRALAINEASLGPEHPDVATGLSNLALLFQETNRLAEAEPLMRRALAITEASFGLEHPKLTVQLSNLALLLQDTHGVEVASTLVQQYQAKLADLTTQPISTSEVITIHKLPLDDNAWLALRLRTFINDSRLLPAGTEFRGMSAEGPVFRDSNGQTVNVTQLSDGFRSILSLAFELIRQLVRVYGLAAVFPLHGVNGVIEVPGVVLIDEVDTHLHPTWQTRIGQWFTKCFPQIQFIVTTHSPIICRAVGDTSGSIWRLPTPGQGKQVEEVTGTDRQRLRLGNVLDAYGTGLFGGQEVEQSSEATAMLAERAKLSAKDSAGKTTSAERARLRELEQLFSSVDATIEY